MPVFCHTTGHIHTHSHAHETHVQFLFIRLNFVSVCVYLPLSPCGVSPVSFPWIRMIGHKADSTPSSDNKV